MIILLLVILLASVIGVGIAFFRLDQSIRELTSEVRELRTTSRARVNQVVTGDPKVNLVRTGRAAKGKRVVVGGNPNSLQHRVLKKTLGDKS